MFSFSLFNCIILIKPHSEGFSLFSFCISCQDIHVLVRSAQDSTDATAQRLQKDFSNFKPGQENQASIVLELTDKPLQVPSLAFAFKTSQARVYGWGKTRFVFYPHHTQLVSLDGNPRTIQISSPNMEALYEFSYFALLSSLGEALEKKHNIRVHSFSFSFKDRGYLLHFSSGLGKSTLAALLSQEQNFKILGDEITLFKENRLFAFPLRMAFSRKSADFLGLAWDQQQVFQRKGFEPKLLLPLSQKQILDSVPFEYILYGTKSSNTESQIIKKIPFFTSLKFLFDLSIGKHLPQIIELALRGSSLRFLPIMILRRIGLGLKLLANKKVHTFYVTKNPDNNKLALIDYLNSFSKGNQ